MDARTPAVLLAALLFACNPGADESPAGDTERFPPRSPDDAGDTTDPRRSPDAHPGPCSIVRADNGEPRATFTYDDEGRITAAGLADGPFVGFTYEESAWTRTVFVNCRLDGPDAATRRTQLETCVRQGVPTKAVDYTYTEGRLEEAVANPTLRTGGEVRIAFSYRDAFIDRESRQFTEPDAPDGSRRTINDVLYTWTRNHIGRNEPGHNGETYRVDDSILPASPLAVCMLLTDSPRQFPRGRCLALAQADAAIAEYAPPEGPSLTFSYDEAGNIERVERADGVAFEAKFGCWEGEGG